MKKKILLVDEEPDITSTFKTGLEEKGFDVDAFNDPLLALSKFKAGMYDIVLLDIRMPNMDGFDLYKELQRIDSKTKVCFVTAFEVYYEALRELFPDSRVECFIRKPVGIDELVGHINKELSAM